MIEQKEKCGSGVAGRVLSKSSKPRPIGHQSSEGDKMAEFNSATLKSASASEVNAVTAPIVYKKLTVKQEFSRAVSFQIHSAIDQEGLKCKLCNFKGTLKEVKTHARQHFARLICKCGYSTLQRSQMIDHRSSCVEDTCYEADKYHYQQLCNEGKISTPVEFGHLLAITAKEGKCSSIAVRIDAS